MYNDAVTTQPTRAMWWAEMVIGLAVAAVALTMIMLLLPLAAGHRVTLDVGGSALLIVASLGVGVFVSGRFRAWGLHRQSSDHTPRS
ncbi:hypothetical protein [Streptomyces sp. NPDC059909]|uniref:hypothetical protein n=1 Tax=Streptomyces sp. NPDC059909 TaxID=3346998 RepID=UPI00364C37D9